MDNTVNFPGGQAVLRDRPNVGGRALLIRKFTGVMEILRERVPHLPIHNISDIANLPKEMVDEDIVDKFMELQKAGIVAFVQAWTLGPPPTWVTVDEMDSDVFDFLAEHTAPRITKSIFGPSFGVSTDPKAPTGNSGDLGIGSSLDQTPAQNLQTETSPASTTSTGSDASILSLTPSS